MDIRHNENIHSHSKRGAKLTPLPINQTFFWEEQEIFLPAVYVGKAGAVLDICAKIPLEDMAAFLQKWDKKRRHSLRTREDYAKIEAENPAARDFFTEISLDGTLLTNSMSSSLYWYPPSIFKLLDEEADDSPAKEHKNDNYAEELMETYVLDRLCLWRISRHSFNWNGVPILSPHSISLMLRADTLSIAAGHFTTNAFCNNDDKRTLKFFHPLNGKEYTLTLHRCEQNQVNMDGIAEENLSYPDYVQKLSYSISPEISCNLIDILDCADSESARTLNTVKNADSEPARTLNTVKNAGSANGPTAIFLAGKSAHPKLRTAVSSLHFAPVETVRWRIVFHIKPKEDMKINLPIQYVDS